MSKTYVVFSGMVLGIFYTWDLCRSSVEGFSGASYKSYNTFEEAEKAWKDFCNINNHQFYVDTDNVKDIKKNYYVVIIGRKLGVFINGYEFDRSIHNYPNAKYRIFNSIDEAVQFWNDWLYHVDDSLEGWDQSPHHSLTDHKKKDKTKG